MKILAIETSCDETALALVEATGNIKNPKFKVLKNIVSSQIDVHRPYGGVVPTLAKREHIKNLPLVLKKLKLTSSEIENLDAFSVTVGPGLEPALWAGINFAEKVATQYEKPLLGANHLEGHLYSPLLTINGGKNIPLPAIGLIVSGGHTILLVMDKLESWRKIGETRDDAVGEAYDKVARMLELPYPGGPEIERISKDGDPRAIEFPRPMIHHKNYDFSFSGLKTAVFYHVRDKKLTSKDKADIAASFQAAAIEVLSTKTMHAVSEFGARSVILAGGVAANTPLRMKLARESKKLGVKFIVSDMKYSGDNAAMIGAAAYINYLKGKKYRIKAQANLNL